MEYFEDGTVVRVKGFTTPGTIVGISGNSDYIVCWDEPQHDAILCLTSEYRAGVYYWGDIKKV